MATISKRGTCYQVKIRRKGFPALSANFDTSQEARVIKEFFHRRLESVCGSTGNRDLALLSRTMTYACTNCDIPLNQEALFEVTRPENNPGRKRCLLPGEEERLIAAGNPGRQRTLSVGPRNLWIVPLALLAIETAMRRSEPLAIRWPDVDVDWRVIHLHTSKIGDPRAVPLSTKAVELLHKRPPPTTMGACSRSARTQSNPAGGGLYPRRN